MLDDAELFSQLCQKHGIIAEPEIIEAVKASCVTGELKLAHTSIIASLCEVIAQVLSSSSTMKVIDLSDCMLLSKGLSCILKALCEGSSIISLYLKGNNISGQLVELLGEMLMRNSTLKVMHVEWNNLGSQVDSFTKFCNGLAKNHHIEELDLQYNQISTLCADSLELALKTNKSLKTLNLSWNSLGMSGGQKILQGVQKNRNLISLNLKGNCIPSDICEAIKDQITSNRKRQILCEIPIITDNTHHILESSEEDDRVIQVRSSFTKKKKRERSRTPLKELRGSPLGDSGNDEDDLEIKKSSRIILKKIGNESNHNSNEVHEKIEALNQILQEKSSTIDLLKTEVEAQNMEIKLIKTENEELKIQVQKLKEENNNILEEKTKDLENMKKVQAKAEHNWSESYKELDETYQNTLQLKQEGDAKIRIYEKELKKASLEIQSLKEKLASSLQNYEDTRSDCKIEIHKMKREVQERENRYKIEINTLKETLKETTEALEKCQEQLQKVRNELRESLDVQAKLKIKTDEAERFAARTKKIEEALFKSKDDKDKLEDKLQESRKSVASLQKQIIKLQEESIEPQKRYEAIKLELQLEKEKSLSLKSEIQDERGRIKEQNDQMQKLLSQTNGLYAQISDTQSSHAEALRIKETEIEKLKNVIIQKTRELDDYKSEQIQKAHQFQTAVSKYLGSFGPNSVIS